MSYYQFNRQEILQKAKERYFKEKDAEYYLKNNEVIKEKAREHYKNLSQEEKDKIKEYQKKRYQELVQYKKESLKNKWFLFLLSIKKWMKRHWNLTILYLIRKNFINLIYFIDYKKDEIVKPLCVILPQMNGYIKYFKNGSKNMSFFIRDDEVLDKYNEVSTGLKKIKY